MKEGLFCDLSPRTLPWCCIKKHFLRNCTALLCTSPQVKVLKGMEEDLAKFYIASIVLALEYLHDHNIGGCGC